MDVNFFFSENMSDIVLTTKPYQLVNFIRSSRKADTRSVDITLFKWIRYDKIKKRFVKKYTSEPYTVRCRFYPWPVNSYCWSTQLILFQFGTTWNKISSWRLVEHQPLSWVTKFSQTMAMIIIILLMTITARLEIHNVNTRRGQSKVTNVYRVNKWNTRI